MDSKSSLKISLNFESNSFSKTSYLATVKIEIEKYLFSFCLEYLKTESDFELKSICPDIDTDKIKIKHDNIMVSSESSMESFGSPGVCYDDDYCGITLDHDLDNWKNLLADNLSDNDEFMISDDVSIFFHKNEKKYFTLCLNHLIKNLSDIKNKLAVFSMSD